MLSATFKILSRIERVILTKYELLRSAAARSAILRKQRGLKILTFIGICGTLSLAHHTNYIYIYINPSTENHHYPYT
jgi:hypothetical protein